MVACPFTPHVGGINLMLGKCTCASAPKPGEPQSYRVSRPKKRTRACETCVNDRSDPRPKLVWSGGMHSR